MKETNKLCPHSHKFAVDFEEYEDCEECIIWDSCEEANRDEPPPNSKKKPKSYDYSKLLKHPKWQKKRLKILEQDNFTCQLCGDTETTLHVHHFMYNGKEPWEIDDGCLITYCEDCHSIVEHMNFKKNEESKESITKFIGKKLVYENGFVTLLIISNELNMVWIIEKMNSQIHMTDFSLESMKEILSFITKNTNGQTIN